MTSLKSSVYFTLTEYLNSVQVLSSNKWPVAVMLDRVFLIMKEVEPKFAETYDGIVIIRIFCLRNVKGHKGHCSSLQ